MSSNIISTSVDYELLKPYLDSVPVESGYLLITANCSAEWMIKNQVRLLVVSAGVCVVTENGKESILHQNDIRFLFNNSQCVIRSSSHDPTELWWLDMYGRGVSTLLSALSINDEHSCIRGISNPGLLRELKNLVIYCSDITASDALQSLAGLYHIMSILIDEGENSSWTTVPYTSEDILYTGVWSKWPSPRGNQHNECYTGTARSYAEFNFFGSGIKWYGTLNFDCGKADVIIDGIYQTTVDAYNPTRLPKQLLYSNTRLLKGYHIIKIFCTGESNDKATNCDVVVESFQYYSSTDEPMTVRSGFYSGLIQQATKLMNAGYMQEFSIDQLSRELNVSRAYLTSKFSSEMGLSPMQYLVNLRMSRARYLLLTSELPVSKIGESVGFKDAFYFSRFFKKNDGMSPTQYREAHVREAAMLQNFK